MKQINWGIIGCGDVTEVKSGPAFNKADHSKLVAVMRRDAAKAEDYARRHNVPKWFSDANLLINDPDVNAIYIATPPSSHEEYAIAAMQAGKPVYIEKPVSVDYPSAKRIAQFGQEKNIKMCVAHYRRQQPLFKKIKEIIDDKIIGEVRVVNMICYKKLLSQSDLTNERIAWRVNAEVSGGGLFYDLAPHQLDLMIYFFGEVTSALGVSANQAKLYKSEDVVSGNILFKNGTVFSGTWCFTTNEFNDADHCEIIGSKGKISFAVFEHQKISLMVGQELQEIPFQKLQHVQEPMIAAVVKYFLNEAPNPCSAGDGAEVMRLMDSFTGKIV